MPLHKKKKSTGHAKIIFVFALIAVLVVLMIISFPPASNITEIVLYP